MRKFFIEGDIFDTRYYDLNIGRKILNEFNEFNRPTRWPNKTIPYQYEAKFCTF